MPRPSSSPILAGPALVMAADLAAARERTLALVAHLDTADLERQIVPILSPLVWDLGHIAAYEDLWLVHRHGGRDLLHGELAARYDAFETPRAVRGDLDILGHADALRYLRDVRARTIETMAAEGVHPVLHEMVLRHELQHTETMRQAMEVAGLLPAGEPGLSPLVGDPEDPTGGWITLPAGRFEMGAGDDVFAYDNERPRRPVATSGFRIARRPVTNASWLTFTEGGGYERREWWSDEGWAWKEDQDGIGGHARAGGARGPDAAASPVCHVAWFEADAFARSVGARLPTEAEWERAATWDQRRTDADEGSRSPGATWDQRRTDADEGSRSPGATWDQGGRLEGIGLVWEWTSTGFDGYPGFAAHPYREYSEVFFAQGHRVLRGGSWATDPRVATRTFRNWDLPQRHQIFSGVRLAADLPAAPTGPASHHPALRS